MMREKTGALTSRRIAFTTAMVAVSNILGFPIFTVPLGFMSIHFMQIPIILAALTLGPATGALVGLTGAATMAFTLQTSNLYILLGNAILGACVGAFYAQLKRFGRRPVVPQTLAVLGAFMVQAPYVYATDFYLMGMPQPLVLTILEALLAEDIISVVVAHIVLYRARVAQSL